MHCGFTKVDLQNIVHIIETCTKRGAFQAEEMSGVGQLYDRLKASLKKCEDKVIKECVDGVCKLNCDDGVCEKESGGCPLDKENLGNTGT